MKNEKLNLGFSVDVASLKAANAAIQSVTSSIGAWVNKVRDLGSTTGIVDKALQKTFEESGKGYDDLGKKTGNFVKNKRKVDDYTKTIKMSGVEYTKYNKKLKESGKSFNDFGKMSSSAINLGTKNQSQLRNSLRASQKEIDEFGGFEDMTSGIRDFGSAQESILDNLNNSLESVTAKTGIMSGSIDDTVMTLESLGESFEENNKKSKDMFNSFEEGFSSSSNTLAGLRDKLANLPSGLMSAAGSIGGAIRGISDKVGSMKDSLTRGFSSVTSSIKDSAFSLGSLFPPLAALGGATGGILSIKGAFESAWNSGQELEKMTVKMTNRFGSSDYAKKATGFINDMSQEYGIAKDELTSYATELGEMGMSVDKVNFKGVLNAANGPGKDLQSTMSAMTALAEGGDFQSFTKAFGNTIDPTALQESLAGATTYQERMQKTADFLDVQFAGNTDRMKNSTEGQIASISGFFEKIQQTISGSGAFRAMQDVLTNIFTTIENNKEGILEVAKTIGSMMGSIVKFIGGLMGNITGTMGGTTGFFKSLVGKMKDIFYPIMFILGYIGMKIGSIITKVFKGDMAGATVEFGALIAKVLGFLGNMINKVLDFIPGLLRGLRELSPSIGKAVQSIVDSIVTFASGLPGRLTKIIDELFPTLGQLIKDVLPPILNGAIDIITTWLPQIPRLIWSAFSGAFNLLLDIGSILPGIFNNLLNKLSAAVSDMLMGLGTYLQQSDNPIVQFFGKIVSWAGEFDKVKVVLQGIGIVIGGIVAYMAGQYAVEMAKIIASWVAQKAAMVSHYAAQTIAFVKEKAQMVVNFGLWVGQNAAILAGYVAQGAAMAANAVVAAAMWVATLGPIALIVAGITLLVGGFVLLYKKCDWFRKLVDLLWEGIKIGVQLVWEIVKKYFTFIWDMIKFVFDFFKRYVTLIVDNVKAIFKGLFDTFSKLFTGDFKGALDSFLGIFKNIFSNVSAFFGETFENLKAIFSNLFSGETLANLWDSLKSFFMSLPSKIGTILSGAFKGIGNIGEMLFGDGIFDGLISMFKNAVNMMIKIANHIPGVDIPLMLNDSKIKTQIKMLPKELGVSLADATKGTDFSGAIGSIDSEFNKLVSDGVIAGTSEYAKVFTDMKSQLYDLNKKLPDIRDKAMKSGDMSQYNDFLDQISNKLGAIRTLGDSSLDRTGKITDKSSKNIEDFLKSSQVQEASTEIKQVFTSTLQDTVRSVAEEKQRVLDAAKQQNEIVAPVASGKSIKDGIIDNGKITPTDPNDLKVATKNPEKKGIIKSLMSGDFKGAATSLGEKFMGTAASVAEKIKGTVGWTVDSVKNTVSSVAEVAKIFSGQKEKYKTGKDGKIIGNLGFQDQAMSDFMAQSGYKGASDSGDKEGAAWCAAFVKSAYASVFKNTPEVWDKIKSKFGFGALSTLREVTKTGLFEKSKSNPVPGSLMAWEKKGDPEKGHIGLVTEVMGDVVKTIEGNTGSDGTNREGVMVAEITNPIKGKKDYDRGTMSFAGFANPKFDSLLSVLSKNTAEPTGTQSIGARGEKNLPAKDFVIRPGQKPMFFEPTDTVFGVRKTVGLEGKQNTNPIINIKPLIETKEKPQKTGENLLHERGAGFNLWAKELQNINKDIENINIESKKDTVQKPLLFEPKDKMFGVDNYKSQDTSPANNKPVSQDNSVSITFGTGSIVINSTNPTYDAQKLLSEIETLIRRKQGRMYGVESQPNY